MKWIEELDDLLATVEDTAKGNEGDMITKARGLIQEHRFEAGQHETDLGSSNGLIMTAVDFLAERYNYITWMRNRDEISAGTADEWRAKFLKEAKEMEEQQLNKAWEDGAVTAQNDAAKEIEKNYVARVR